MSRLIESIRLFDGMFSRLELHQARLDNSFQQVYKSNPKWRLKTFLATQEIPTQGLYKCRVVCDDKSIEIEFNPYQVRKVETLKLVTTNALEYNHKWEDRSQLDVLYSQRENYDDILIVRNGLITDTFYTNIVFGKNGKWYTPQSYLLAGTMRQFLLKSNVIGKRVISVENFLEYDQFKLINSMLEWDSPALDVSNIY